MPNATIVVLGGVDSVYYISDAKMSRIIKMLLLLVTAIGGYGTPALSQTVVLDQENQLHQPLPLYLNFASFYLDSSGKLDVTTVARQPFQPYHHYFPKVPRHLPTNLPIWMSFQLRNGFDQDTTIVFYPGFQNYVEVYEAEAGRFARTAVCGNMFPASILDIPDMRQALVLPVKANRNQQYFIRIYNRTTYHVDPFRPYLMSTASLNELQVDLLQRNRLPSYIFFIGIGMFLIMLVYVSITWIYSKDIAYFYYAITIVAGTIFFLLNYMQDGNNQLFLLENPLVLYLLPDAFAWIGLYGYWQFVTRFLYLKEKAPALAAFMKLTSNAILLFAALNLLYAFFFKHIMSLILIDTIVGIVLLIIGSYTLVRIRRVESSLRKFIYAGISCMLVFYGLGWLYEVTRDASWNRLPDLGGGTPIIMMGNITEMLFFSFGLAYRTKLEAGERSKMQAAMAEAELKALRAQMNPHFIFNCMNTIDAYIFREEPEKASKFLQVFSQLIRSVLENSEHGSISLARELEGVRLFLQLECERYENAFDVSIEVPENILQAHYQVPPLILQPYVENAIGHGLRHKKNGRGLLQIRVDASAEALHIWIRDNGIGRKAAQRIKAMNGRKHQSFALSLTQQRLDLLPGKGSVEIIDIDGHGETGTEVRLHFPINQPL